VFVAGGIGITPFRSIVKWLLDTGEKRQLQVLLAAHAKNDLVFVDLFEGYGVKPVIVLEEPPAHWNGPVGRLSAELILKIMGEVGNKLIYISGPEPMVEALNEDLEKHQVPKEQLVGDFFPGYTGI
jgi:ferredoxin-NADP reductase